LPAPTKRNNNSIGVIDIFAGPGGLGEGFSSFVPQPSSRRRPFKLAVSAEMEKSAHETLRLRSFFRSLQQYEGEMPVPYASYLADVAAGRACSPGEQFGAGRWREFWSEADKEALNLTMGEQEHNRRLHERIKEVQSNFNQLILIGGPPCQAYSVVGRARQRHVKGFRTKGDHRHFLYRQYLEILSTFAPDVFIMENVKGILTSRVGGNHMFSAIVEDLSNPSRALGISTREPLERREYVLLPVHIEEGTERCAEKAAINPSSFIIRCEKHGVPQARHRVIIMGVRTDHAHKAVSAQALESCDRQISIKDALAGLPKLRSGISYEKDDVRRWIRTVEEQRRLVISSAGKGAQGIRDQLRSLNLDPSLSRTSNRYSESTSAYSVKLRHPQQKYVLNHETRGHMASDLGRYLFCSAFGLAQGRSPNSSEFPGMLSPDHANWGTGAFSDRFRVQLREKPSSTVTSHLSKDGHAFIHWDPAQCRSLTVREAARLQSFPDDYLFLGNRTQQFVQVGNAVPPLIAQQIARVVWSILEPEEA